MFRVVCSSSAFLGTKLVPFFMFHDFCGSPAERAEVEGGKLRKSTILWTYFLRASPSPSSLGNQRKKKQQNWKKGLEKSSCCRVLSPRSFRFTLFRIPSKSLWLVPSSVKNTFAQTHTGQTTLIANRRSPRRCRWESACHGIEIRRRLADGKDPAQLF